MSYETIKTAETGQLKWWDFHQNNSGGYFIKNSEVDEIVLIQAYNADEANKKAFKIFEDHSSYCSCCGKRWSYTYEDGCSEPSVYGEPLDEYEFFEKDSAALLYYHNGMVIRYTKE